MIQRQNQRLPPDLNTNGLKPVDVVNDILGMQAIATHLRKARYDKGCLSLNRKKLELDLGARNKQPPEILGIHMYEGTDSNKLVEEVIISTRTF